jgi:hypothetical protein
VGCQTVRGQLIERNPRSVQDRAHASQKIGERTGSRPSAAEGGGAPAPALRPADQRSTQTQLLPGDRALLPPSSARLSADLTPASGCQDHTALPSASGAFVKTPSASITSRPASVTIAKRPLPKGRDGWTYNLICLFWKSEYFAIRGLTGNCELTRRANHSSLGK